MNIFAKRMEQPALGLEILFCFGAAVSFPMFCLGTLRRELLAKQSLPSPHAGYRWV